MTRITKLAYTIALTATATLSIILGIWRSLLLFNSYDVRDGHFTSVSADIIGIITAFAVFAIVIYCICNYRKLNIKADSGQALLSFPSAFVVVILFTHLFFSLASFANIETNRTLSVAIILLELFSAVFYIYNIFSRAARNEKKSIFAICCIAFLSAYTVFRYIDTELAISSPQKSAEIFSLIILTLFSVYECRLALGRESWVMHVMTGMCSVLVGFSFSLSNIIHLFSENSGSDSFVISNFIIFSMSLYAAVRLCSVLLCKNLVEEHSRTSEDYSDLPYAQKSESERFRISEERLESQSASASETLSASETVVEKINCGTEDYLPENELDDGNRLEEE